MKLLSLVPLFGIPWTVVYQASLSMGFSRQEYWSGLPFLSPGDLPNPGIKPRSPTLQANSLPSGPLRKPKILEWVACLFSSGSSWRKLGSSGCGGTLVLPLEWRRVCQGTSWVAARVWMTLWNFPMLDVTSLERSLLEVWNRPRKVKIFGIWSSESPGFQKIGSLSLFQTNKHNFM